MTATATAMGTPGTIADAWLGQGLTLGAQRAVIPRVLARNPLFAAIAPTGKRKVYKTDTELASWGNDKKPELKTVVYQCAGGEQLTQAEESVWLELLRLALQAPMPHGQEMISVRFSGNGMLRALGKDTGSQNRTDLLAAVTRLGRTRLRVTAPAAGGRTKIYENNLLALSASSSKSDAGYNCKIDMDLAALFSAGWSFVNLTQRQALRSNPVAQWLHTHYSTHSTPNEIGQGKIKALCGRAKTRSKLPWPEELRKALAELQAATGWLCRLTETGNVAVRKRAAPDELIAATVVAAESTAAPTSSDSQLLAEWTQTLTRAEVLVQINAISKLAISSLSQGHSTLNELRTHLIALLEAPPQRLKLQRRLVKLRAAAADKLLADAAAAASARLHAEAAADAELLRTAVAHTRYNAAVIENIRTITSRADQPSYLEDDI